MLKEKRIFSFNKLDDISSAYKFAFRLREKGKDGTMLRGGVIPGIAALFAGEEYPDLSMLEAIRHVTVHRGGRVDAQFAERMKGKNVPFDLADKSLILLDGEIVQRCTKAAVMSAYNLLMGVDTWLTNNVEKRRALK